MKLDIAAYHPQPNAKLERIHRTYSDAISKYVDSTHTNWGDFFPYVQWAYRTSIQDTICETPFKLVFGRIAPDFIDLALHPPNSNEDIDDQDDSKQVKIYGRTNYKNTSNVKKRLLLLYNRNIMWHILSKYSTPREPRIFNIGEKVMILDKVKYAILNLK